MPSRWFACLAHAVFALLLTFSAVNLTVPGAFARTVAESTADDDENRESEAVVSALARHSATPDRTANRFARRSGPATAGLTPSLRTAPGARVASADPLGARLRC